MKRLSLGCLVLVGVLGAVAATRAAPAPGQEPAPQGPPVADQPPVAPDAPPGYEDAPPNPGNAPATEVLGAATLGPAVHGAQPADEDAPPGYGDALAAEDLGAVALPLGPREVGPLDLDNIEQLLAMDLDAEAGVNVKQYEQQLLPQIQPMLNSELSFLHRVCPLNGPQRKAFHAQGLKAVKVAARQYAKAQMSGYSNATPDAAQIIELALIKTAQKQLPADQAQQYAQAVSERAALQQRVGARSLVAILDRRLVLSEEQRLILTEKLEKGCQNAWQHALTMFLQDNQYFPADVPEKLILPVLTPPQMTVWRSIPKANFGSWGFMAGMNQFGMALNDFPLDEN